MSAIGDAFKSIANIATEVVDTVGDVGKKVLQGDIGGAAGELVKGGANCIAEGIGGLPVPGADMVAGGVAGLGKAGGGVLDSLPSLPPLV
jgi:hypothetical protein